MCVCVCVCVFVCVCTSIFGNVRLELRLLGYRALAISSSTIIMQAAVLAFKSARVAADGGQNKNIIIFTMFSDEGAHIDS